MVTPAETSRPATLLELRRATAFLRGDRSDHPLRRRPVKSDDKWRQLAAVEEQLRRELIAASENWHLLDRLTPREMVVLLAMAVENNSELAADRLCISTQTLKNHITNVRQRIFGDEYAEIVGKRITSGLLTAMAVRWALDYESRVGPL